MFHIQMSKINTRYDAKQRHTVTQSSQSWPLAQCLLFQAPARSHNICSIYTLWDEW